MNTHAMKTTPAAQLDRLDAKLEVRQLAMWLALPTMLVGAGLAREDHWQVYLPAVLGSFVVMGGSLFQLEKHGYLRAADHYEGAEKYEEPQKDEGRYRDGH